MNRLVVSMMLAVTVVVGSTSPAQAAAPCHFGTVKVSPYKAHQWVVGAKLFRGSKAYKHRRVSLDLYDASSGGFETVATGKTNSRGRAFFVGGPDSGMTDTLQLRFSGNKRTAACASRSVDLPAR